MIMDDLTQLCFDVWLCAPAPGGGAPWFCRVEFKDGASKRKLRGCVGDTWEEAAGRVLEEVREALCPTA